MWQRKCTEGIMLLLQNSNNKSISLWQNTTPTYLNRNISSIFSIPLSISIPIILLLLLIALTSQSSFACLFSSVQVFLHCICFPFQLLLPSHIENLASPQTQPDESSPSSRPVTESLESPVFLSSLVLHSPVVHRSPPCLSMHPPAQSHGDDARPFPWILHSNQSEQNIGPRYSRLGFVFRVPQVPPQESQKPGQDIVPPFYVVHV